MVSANLFSSLWRIENKEKKMVKVEKSSPRKKSTDKTASSSPVKKSPNKKGSPVKVNFLKYYFLNN